MSGFVPIDLIKQIKIRPGIYNKDVLTAPRREHRLQLWLEVAESLTPAQEWANYTEAEKEMRIGEVANKWKNLRDHFYREIKLLESGEAHKKRKYIYFDEMEFVRPYIGYKQTPKRKVQTRSTDSATKAKNEARDDDSDIDMNEFLKSKKVPDRSGGCMKRSLRSQHKMDKKNRKKASFHNPSSGNHSHKPLIENFNVSDTTDSDKKPAFKIREGDISFCLSLVPTLRQMTDVRKLSAKIDILKILHNNMVDIERKQQESSARQDNFNDSNQNIGSDEFIEEYEETSIKENPLDDSDNSNTWWT